jgi:protein SCO1
MNRLFLVAALALAGCQRAAPAPPPLAGARIGGPFALTDQDGRPVTDRTFAGRYTIVYFGYTFCPDACPTDMGAIGAGLRKVEHDDPAKGAKVTPIFVTVDPARDSPAVLKQFVRQFHPRAVGLTGPMSEIDKVATEFGVAHSLGPKSAGGGYLVDHSRAAYLMGPDGRPIALAGADGGPAEVARTIERWVP